jgi:hypothetical protein
MANMETGGNSNPKMIKATGTGTNVDPFVIEFSYLLPREPVRVCRQAKKKRH